MQFKNCANEERRNPNLVPSFLTKEEGVETIETKWSRVHESLPLVEAHPDQFSKNLKKNRFPLMNAYLYWGGILCGKKL